MSFRKNMNILLRKYGYEIKKVDRFKECLIAEYDSNDLFNFIQVGANDGVKFDGLYDFVTSRKCRGVVIEPLMFYFNQLKNNYSKYPEITPLNCAVHPSKKKVILHYVDPGKLDLLPEWAQGIGSLDSNHHKKSNTVSEYIITEEAKAVHLMDIIYDNNFESLSLLQIDAEGFDGEVIRMIDFNVIKPAIIKYESGQLGNEGEEIVRYLESHKYNVFTQGDDSIAVCITRRC